MVIIDGQKKNKINKYNGYKKGANKLIEITNFIFQI